MRILVATDGSPEAEAACQFLRLLPLPDGSTFHVASAVHIPVGAEGHAAPWQTIEVLFEYHEAWAQKVVQQTQELLAREGVTITTSIPRGEPAPQILRLTDTMAPDLVVIGSHGLTGLASFLLGSVARSVAKGSQRPVLVGRMPRNDLREVVVATDGSEHASHALRFAAQLPLPAETQMSVVHVIRPHRPLPGFLPGHQEVYEQVAAEVRERQQESGRKMIETAEALLAPSGRPVRKVLRVGDPTTEILKLAAERCADLIIAGARGVSLIQGLVMGSVADRLLKHAPCSVLIVR
jgi:nucleotide-binding universal stress UspA family protein